MNWFWPGCAAFAVLAVVVGTLRQDVVRRVQARQHKQRIDTAHALLNDHPPFVEPEGGVIRSVRELGGLVERVGHTLDDLLAEVHAEKSADQRARRT